MVGISVVVVPKIETTPTMFGVAILFSFYPPKIIAMAIALPVVKVEPVAPEYPLYPDLPE